MIPRYIPELQSLCARQIAEQIRSMSQEERYNALRQIPEHLLPLIKAFPLNFIVWICDEAIMNTEIIQHYLEHKEDRKYITGGYEKDCKYGITRKKVLLRKCANHYCENTVFGKIIQDYGYDIRFLLCDECCRITMGKWIKMRLFIEKFRVD